MTRSVHAKPLVLSMILLCIACATGVPAQAGTREAMAEAMARMMEAMGMFQPSGMSSMPMGLPFGAYGLTPGLGGMSGTAPWGMPFQDPSGAFGKGGQWMNQFSRGMPMPGSGGAGKQMFPWMGSPLEGVWEGRNGELLIVQGDRFRIYPGNAGYVDGYLKLSGDRLAMYNPSDQNARPFEYAESEGRMVLRDAAGQIYLYRRLWLQEAEGTGATTAREK
jgi:hypothetical protein